jgi:hypothetical protein
MSKLFLSSALVAAFCVPALATPVASSPVAGAGFPIIALGLGGLVGIYCLANKRPGDL